MRVVINFKYDGTIEVATDDQCEVYTVCDYAKYDRVYRLSQAHMIGPAAVDAILRDDPSGHASDDRHEAIKNRILSADIGEPHLKPVT